MPSEEALKKEISLYLFFGMVQLSVDTLMLIALHSLLALDIATANVASRLLAAMLGYQLNSRFNFRPKQREKKNHLLRFSAWWLLATLAGSLALHLAETHIDGSIDLILCKILIEGIIVVATFFTLKTFVFR